MRVCDNGGWTDTWFARHRKVFNIAVSPLVEVEVRAEGYHLRPAAERIVLHVENFGDRYAVDLAGRDAGRHPMLEAAVRCAAIPPDVALDIRLHSEAPPGASMGTLYFLHHRKLLGALSRAAQETVKELMVAAVPEEKGLSARDGFGGPDFWGQSEFPPACPRPRFPGRLDGFRRVDPRAVCG